MTKLFNKKHEDQLLADYVSSLTISHPGVIQSQLICACREFRRTASVGPEDSILNHAHTTAWLAVWKDDGRFSTATLALRLSALCRWWDWLFARRMLQSNVLAFCSPKALASESLPVLALSSDLHRLFERFFDSQSGWGAYSQRQYRMYLRKFVRNVCRESGLMARTSTPSIDARLIGTWLKEVTRTSNPKVLQAHVQVLNSFLDFLVAEGKLSANPLTKLVRDYPLRGRAGVVRALLEPEPEAALKRLSRPPLFKSCLATHLHGFLALKRAMGRRYWSQVYGLSEFDRFVALQHSPSDGLVSKDLLLRYVASRSKLSPVTLRTQLYSIRQFCLYLHRFEARVYLPDHDFCRIHVPRFLPYPLPPDRVRQLIEAVEQLHLGRRWPLWPDTFRTLLRLLYTAGLRLGEALRLQIADVDLDQGILRVRDTKFFKSRLVPLRISAKEALRSYAGRRNGVLGTPEPGGPFFANAKGRFYHPSTLQKTFQSLVRISGVPIPAGRRPPRLHDLRHAFARERLVTWYRDGADVQSKLPLLATYLGHVSITSTQVYLGATPELLEQANLRFERYGASVVGIQDGENNENR